MFTRTFLFDLVLCNLLLQRCNFVFIMRGFRLEVQADVNTGHTNKRASLSSESANFSLDAKSAYSLDAKSATVSFSDDASTKALAGSICNRYVVFC